jgi:putative iron-only hydrogenase system regulator
MTDSAIALIGIIVTEGSPTEKLNAILHDYSEYVIGRMGVPYHKANLNVISVAVDGPLDEINAMSGKLGRLPGITTKTVYAARPKAAGTGGASNG